MKCKSCKNRGKRKCLSLFLGILSLVTVVLCLSASCNADGRKAQKYAYGVFLNADRKAVPKLKNYETVVIDAQYFSKKDIRKLHADGTKKFTAILILALSKISGHIIKHTSIWQSGIMKTGKRKKWVNVADKDWQEFMDTLAGKLKKKRSGWLFY